MLNKIFKTLLLVIISTLSFSFFYLKQNESQNVDRYSITKSRMPLVYKVGQKITNKLDKKVLIGLPLTFETLSIIDAIKDKFAKVMVIPQSSGPHSSTQKGVFKYLKAWGVKYYETATENDRIKALSEFPDIIVDCSFMLGEVAIKHKLFNEKTIFIEDTKTGENRLLSLTKGQSPFSRTIVLDNSYYKRNYENQIGIGYSVVGSLVSMGFFLPFYKVGVVGYGYVGSGTARFARALGAKSVLVTDIEEQAKKRAVHAGFPVVTLKKLLQEVDIVITATGKTNIITKEDLKNLNKKIILANAGGELEWDREKMFDLERGTTIHEDIVKCYLGDTEVWELGSGNSINLVRQIPVTEFLDITFAQLIHILNEVSTKKDLPKGTLPIKSFESKEFRELFSKTYKELA